MNLREEKDFGLPISVDTKTGDRRRQRKKDGGLETGKGLELASHETQRCEHAHNVYY